MARHLVCCQNLDMNNMRFEPWSHAARCHAPGQLSLGSTYVISHVEQALAWQQGLNDPGSGPVNLGSAASHVCWTAGQAGHAHTHRQNEVLEQGTRADLRTCHEAAALKVPCTGTYADRATNNDCGHG